MTNAELITKIRNEIERLYDGEAPKHDQQCEFEDGYFTGISTISNFLSTLESEKPMNQEELVEEVKRYYSDNFDYISSDQPTLSILTNIARHFAKWGAEHSGSSEIPNDLEEAAKAYALDTAEDSEQYSARYLGYKDGAKWQKEQTEKRWLEDRDGCFWDGVEEGKKAMKEQMMKEAVEGEICHDRAGVDYLDYDIARLDKYIFSRFKVGDKVRIIVIPKED